MGSFADGIEPKARSRSSCRCPGAAPVGSDGFQGGDGVEFAMSQITTTRGDTNHDEGKEAAEDEKEGLLRASAATTLRVVRAVAFSSWGERGVGRR